MKNVDIHAVRDSAEYKIGYDDGFKDGVEDRDTDGYADAYREGYDDAYDAISKPDAHAVADVISQFEEAIKTLQDAAETNRLADVLAPTDLALYSPAEAVLRHISSLTEHIRTQYAEEA